MMKMKRRILAQAVVLAVSSLAASWSSAACPAIQAKPFTAGPIAAQPANLAARSWTGPFSEWVVDSNGVGLQICTTAADAAGNPPPCFLDPATDENTYTSSLNRGGEAFWFLADSVGATTGANPINWVIVMGVESAFLSDPPAPGFEIQFQRLRTRINVAAAGRYVVETPWGTRSYDVAQADLLPAGNGQNRMEISEPIDITFTPGSNAGLVTPFLVADNKPALAGLVGVNANDFIGDGVTPTTVTGSPCGQNFVRITATDPATGAGIDINNGANSVTVDTFTVMGHKAPLAAVPLAITGGYYTRKSGAADLVTVMADTSASASAFVTLSGAAVTTVNLAKDGVRSYKTVEATAPITALNKRVDLVAQDSIIPSQPNPQHIDLTDLVTITRAEASCTGTGAAQSCQLIVEASSSDDGSGPGGAPTLSIKHSGDAINAGSITTTSNAVPATVTVNSSAGGSATKAVTIN